LIADVLMWTLILGWPGTAPIWLVGVAFGVFAVGGPASAIGFGLAKDYNSDAQLGTASGVVNVGGFVAATVSSLLIGVLLNVTGDNFRLAFAAMLAILVFGSWRMLVWWRRARAVVFQEASQGNEVPVSLSRRWWDKKDLDLAA
jgi:MFS family permease